MDEKQNRKRGANYTAQEKTLFADLVRQFKHIIEDKRTTGFFISKKKEAWNTITAKYNSNCSTGRRKTEHLKALYDNMKQKARKNVGESNKIEHINREPLMQLQVAEEDLEREVKIVKEGFYKPKTESDAKILATIQDKVIPLSNPFDCGAVYFNDATEIQERTMDESPKSLQVGSLGDTNLCQEIQLINRSGTEIYVDPLQLVIPKQEPEATEASPDQLNIAERKMLKSRNMNTRKAPVIPKKLKRNMSTEALKRIYFKNKCRNALLERKKLMQEILQNKEQHRLKILILKKNLDSLSQ